MIDTSNSFVRLTVLGWLFSSLLGVAVASDARLLIRQSDKNPQAFIFQIADKEIVQRSGYTSCGVEIFFGDGKSAELEVDLGKTPLASIEHAYDRSLIAEINVKPKKITGWLKSSPACEIYPGLAAWQVVGRRVDAESRSNSARDFDIVVLARQAIIKRNIDGAIHLVTDQRPRCINTQLLRPMPQGRIRSSEYETIDALRNEEPLIFSLSSIYEQLNIPFVPEVVESTFLEMTKQAPGALAKCSSLVYGDVFGVPRFATDKFLKANAPYKKWMPAAATLIVVGEIPLAEISARSAVLRGAKDENDRKIAALLDAYESPTSDAGSSSIGTLFINQEIAPRFLSSEPFVFCALPSRGAEFAAAAGHRSRGADLLPPDLRERFDRALQGRMVEAFALPARDPKRKVFDQVYGELNDVFSSITENRGIPKSCPVFVGSPGDVVKLKRALEREGIASAYGEQTKVEKARNIWAVRQGFDAWEDMQFAWAIEASLEQVRRFKFFGINSEVSYRGLVGKIRESGYADDPGVSVALQYLIDVQDAQDRGTTAITIRDLRRESERLAAEKTLEAQRRAREEYLAEFPFEAVVSCGPGSSSHMTVIACFAALQGGIATALELRNGETYGLYRAGELKRLGEEIPRVGLVIPLRARFSLNAENSSEQLVLTVRVRKSLSGEEVFVKSATQFQSINVSR